MRLWFERLRSQTAAFIHDLLMIPAAWMLAYWLRFNLGDVPPEFVENALWSLPLVMAVMGTAFWRFGLYRGVWRFASMTDLIRITKAVLVGTGTLLLLFFVFDRMSFIPRSVPVLFATFQLLLLAGPRLIYRWLKDRHLDLRSGQRVLIVGAGRAGEMLTRDMLRDPLHAYVPVAFVDDKLRRQGGDVHGIPIRGRLDHLPALAHELDVDLVMIAVPSASAREMQRVVRLCEESGKPFRTVPQLSNLMSGQVTISQLRPVSIEDLLGRDPVTLEWPSIRDGLAGRVILVSGAGGSIGSELCRQLRACDPQRLILVDNCEHSLYRMEMELLDAGVGPAFERYLVDVTDAVHVEKVFRAERPQIVFHAAAYKHVPLLEDQLYAAIGNNVLGTEVMTRAADTWSCERFVLISTDKAVHPTNVMGASKRVAELVCQAMDRRSTCRFINVRFGNVLGSAGSVVPRFRHQIERGGPVTVTHREIERFFMTIPEACQLIMQAAAIGEGGETFVLDMGEPVKINFLAEQMILLSGQQPGRDVRIEYTGLRPGEKLYEELFYDFEALTKTSHPKIRIARVGEERDCLERLPPALSAMHDALERGDDSSLRSILVEIADLSEGGQV
ncbi:MAG: nucleoside-diphosphate sugar epimerase/dehydratase [Thiohalocapsa sp.]|jgi:FlaA1/EpsC-like NDP-sugar epimerase